MKDFMKEMRAIFDKLCFADEMNLRDYFKKLDSLSWNEIQIENISASIKLSQDIDLNNAYLYNLREKISKGNTDIKQLSFNIKLREAEINKLKDEIEKLRQQKKRVTTKDLGRPELKKEDIEAIIELYNKGYSMRYIAEKTKHSTKTICKYVSRGR